MLSCLAFNMRPAKFAMHNFQTKQSVHSFSVRETRHLPYHNLLPSFSCQVGILSACVLSTERRTCNLWVNVLLSSSMMGLVPKHVRLPMHHCSVEERTPSQFLNWLRFACVEILELLTSPFLLLDNRSALWRHYLIGYNSVNWHAGKLANWA